MKFLGTPFFTEHLRWLLLNRFFLKKVCKYTIKPPQISTFSPDKFKIKEIIHTSGLLLPKTGKATKKQIFPHYSLLPHYLITSLKNELRRKKLWKTKSFSQKQPAEVFCKKDVLRNFAKFTRKHLCWSLYFDKALIKSYFINFLKKRKNSNTGDLL